MIAHSRALIGEAEKEPPFIGRHRVLLSEWRPALRALEALITKVAALESLLEGICPSHGTSTDTIQVQLLYAFTVHAQVDVEVIMCTPQLSHNVVLSQLPAMDCAASQAVAKHMSESWKPLVS